MTPVRRPGIDVGDVEPSLRVEDVEEEGQNPLEDGPQGRGGEIARDEADIDTRG